jgi:hypothetical protein
MDPITLLVLGVLAATGAAAATLVTWAAVRGWINSHRIPGGTARILRTRLATGNYRVVAGVFDQRGLAYTRGQWDSVRLDAELNRRFENGGGTIVVRT